MKIGIIAHDYYPIVEPFQGGLEKFTYLLVRELVYRGHEVVTLCNSGSELSGTMVFYTELGGNWKDDAETLELSKFEQFYSQLIYHRKQILIP